MSRCGTLVSFFDVFDLLRRIESRFDTECIVSFNLEREVILKGPDGQDIVGYGLTLAVTDSVRAVGYRRAFSLPGEIVPSEVPEEEFIDSVVLEVKEGFKKCLRERREKMTADYERDRRIKQHDVRKLS